MSKKYIIISLFGYRSIVSEEKRNTFLRVIYDGMSINRPKCFEEFINNTKNKLWKEMKNMKKKLRSVRTGEIGYLYANKDVNYQVLDENDCVLSVYDTLPHLIEEWKDMPEEPKEYWYIDCYGMILRALYNGNEWDERRKLIGNYFETKEEAELAVRKLKALERLEEKGFRFAYCEEVEGYDDMIRIMAYPGECDMDDVEELFGDKE